MSKIRAAGLKSGSAGLCYLTSECLRGESVPGPLQHLATASMPWLVAALLQSSRPA